jgi:hypothetical protein
LAGAIKIFKGTLYDLSEQQLVDCSHDGFNLGCSGGSARDGYVYYETHKPMEASSYPYNAKYGTCQYNADLALDYNTTGSVSIPKDDVEQMKAAVSQ